MVPHHRTQRPRKGQRRGRGRGRGEGALVVGDGAVEVEVLVAEVLRGVRAQTRQPRLVRQHLCQRRPRARRGRRRRRRVSFRHGTDRHEASLFALDKVVTREWRAWGRAGARGSGGGGRRTGLSVVAQQPRRSRRLLGCACLASSTLPCCPILKLSLLRLFAAPRPHSVAFPEGALSHPKRFHKHLPSDSSPSAWL